MIEYMEYNRTLEDEIDWKVIDQLHSATANFSTTSLELKKIFLILVGIAVPSLIKLTGDKLDISLFVTLYILTLTFWFLDSFTYYYQEKLRAKMNNHFNQIKQRHQVDSDNVGITIEATRTQKYRRLRSVFNTSVSLYWILILLNTFAFILFHYAVIK